nr:hypothetical protein [Desulfonatronum thiodismutans]
MSDGDDQDDKLVVLKLINDPVPSMPDPVKVVFGGQLFGRGRDLGLGQLIDYRGKFELDVSSKFRKLTSCSRAKMDGEVH